MIQVEDKGRDGDHFLFSVTASDSAGSTRHRVTLSEETLQKLTGGGVSTTVCVEAAFRFLLERETKSDILANFDMSVIQLYHPHFERDFAGYLSSTAASGGDLNAGRLPRPH